MHKKVNIGLFVLTLILGWYFCYSIYTRIEFEDQFDLRKKIVTERLLDLKGFQLAYKDANGIFAKELDTLLHFIQNDTFNVSIVTQKGFDSLNEPILDTAYVYMAVRDSLMPEGYTLAEARHIPFSNMVEYNVDAGQIVKGKVTVQVFKIEAPFGAFLSDQDNNLFEPDDSWSIGSMTEATYGGNW